MEWEYVYSPIEYEDVYTELWTLNDFGQQIDLLRLELLLTTDEIDKRKELAQKIENEIKTFEGFASAKIAIVGSTVNSLGFKNSELDLNLEWNNLTGPDYNDYVGEDAMKRILPLMFNRRPPFQLVYRPEVFPREIPIFVAQWSRRNSIKCNFTVNADYTVQHARLISYFSKVEPMFTDLAMVTLMWMKKSFMIDGLKISTWSVILMVVFYMQKQQLLPPVCSLQNTSQANGYQFIENLSWKSSLFVKPSFGYLFMDFFIFYGNFNCDYVISPNTGGELPKASFDKKDEQFKRFGFVIQDPFNLTYATNKNMDQLFGNQLVAPVHMLFHLMDNPPSFKPQD